MRGIIFQVVETIRTILSEAEVLELTGEGYRKVWARLRFKGIPTVDHFVTDVVCIHAARPGRRFEALEPICQGMRKHYGPLVEGIAKSLVLRHDHGPQYRGRHFRSEIAFLGIESGPRPELCQGAGGQRHGRAIHSHTQEAVAVGLDLRHRRKVHANDNVIQRLRGERKNRWSPAYTRTNFCVSYPRNIKEPPQG